MDLQGERRKELHCTAIRTVGAGEEHLHYLLVAPGQRLYGKRP